MAVRDVVVNPNGGAHGKFKEHELAHRYLDGLTGIELGAAAHNPFGLEGSINVAPGDDNEFYREAEVSMCGSYAAIDVEAEAHDLPFEDSSQDYVISSHVFEHLPNPLAALREWIRVIRDGGYIFMIVPKPDALEADKGRPLADLLDWTIADRADLTVDTWDYEAKPVPGGRRGHYFVYDNQTLRYLIAQFFPKTDDSPWLELASAEMTDSKVKNGHTVCYRVHKLFDATTPDGGSAEVFTLSQERVEAPAPLPGDHITAEYLDATRDALLEYDRKSQAVVDATLKDFTDSGDQGATNSCTHTDDGSVCDDCLGEAAPDHGPLEVVGIAVAEPTFPIEADPEIGDVSADEIVQNYLDSAEALQAGSQGVGTETEGVGTAEFSDEPAPVRKTRKKKGQ